MKDKATFIYKLYIFLIIAIAIFLIYILITKAIEYYSKTPATIPTTTTTTTTKATTTTTTTIPVVTTTEPITTTTTTTTTKKAGTKTTKQKTTTESADPLSIRLEIGFNGFNLYGKIPKIEGGVPPYTSELKIYKNGELLDTVYGLTFVDYSIDPKDGDVYKVYGKVTDSTGESIEGSKELPWTG